jgi:predicted MFS family arabinose efflux permease
MLPLRRNRDFLLLQAGQLFSAAGSESTAIAYPLLVLALTHSPAKAGIVGFARLIPHAFLGLLAGVAADRWNRKRLMIAADTVRAAALAALATTVFVGHTPFWVIPLVAFVEGAGSSVFGTSQLGALRAVVPARQLPAAAGAQEARRAVVRLGGPPLGGALFGVARALPFLADAVSYACSIVSLLAMRAPFQETREPSAAGVRHRIAEGFRYLWSRPFLRTTAFLYGLGNFLMPGVLLIVVVVGREQGLSGGEVGLLLALLGAATLVGSLASPLFRRSLSIRTILLLELWTWLGCWLFVAWPSVYALLAVVVPFGIAAPVTDSVVVGYTVAMTPDRLLGRVESVRRTISLLIAPFGPLVAGLLIAGVSTRAAVGAFAAIGLGLALWGTLSRAIRNAPSLAELDEAATLSV